MSAESRSTIPRVRRTSNALMSLWEDLTFASQTPLRLEIGSIRLRAVPGASELSLDDAR